MALSLWIIFFRFELFNSRYSIMRNLYLILSLFVTFLAYGQVENQNNNSTNIDTLNVGNEINTIDNDLMDFIKELDDNVNLVSNPATDSLNITTIDVPIFNLQDDPTTAAADAKWMDLMRFYDQFEASDMYVENLPSENIVLEELSIEVLKKRLAALDAKSPFNITYNVELERLIKSYIKNRSNTFSNLFAKSKYYFPLFEEKLDLYDVPLEVKYLSIVESALQSRAKSRVGATGLWQFMYQTGKQYGLDVTSYVDERQDPILASEAAAKHLSDLYDIFEDWDLALAAYNSGAGNVNKAIRRSGGKKNYWNIRPYLPRETASYVPIFYATLYLFEYGDKHNIVPSKNFNLKNYEVDTIQVKRTISFDQIKTTIGIDVSLLEFLNPTYKLNIIPYEESKNYHLVLPKEFIGVFVQNEEQIYAYVDAEAAKREKPMPENVVIASPDVEKKVIVYRVKSGDYMGKIAEKHGVSISNIKKWNHLKSNTVHVGQKLKIYKNGSAPSESSASKSESSSSKSKGSTTTYTVKKGDTLFKIASKYQGVSAADIKKWNNLKSDNIKAGSKLKIHKN